MFHCPSTANEMVGSNLLIFKFQSQEKVLMKKGGPISSLRIDRLVLRKSRLIIPGKSVSHSIPAGGPHIVN